MRKLVSLMLVLVFMLTGCAPAQKEQRAKQDVLTMDWSEIQRSAKGSQVRMFMWGGDQAVNRYIDQWVAPRLKEQYGVNLVRTPMNAPEFMQKLTTEKQAELAQGTMDILWLNGENFKNAKENQLLAPAFVQVLPNYQRYIDAAALDVQYDFGTPTEGLEAPWGKVQFVSLYDSAKVSNPPKSFAELAEWVKANPGKFTYPDPADFSGNAFLRHLMYEVVGKDKLVGKKFNAEDAETATKPMWEYLRQIKPYLWREGKTYPQDLTQLDQLFNQGEVWFSMGYNEARAEALIKQGTLPKSTKSFIMEPGSIGNTHFLTIPYNSPNRAGAMVAINFMLSPEAQLAKMDSQWWGENTVLDPSKLSSADQTKLTNLDRGVTVLPAAELKQAILPEVDPAYVEWIKEKWMREVVQAAN